MDLSNMDLLGPCTVASVAALPKDDGVEVVLYVNAAIPINAWAAACIRMAANGVPLPGWCTKPDEPAQAAELACIGAMVQAEDAGIVLAGPFHVTPAANHVLGVLNLTFSGRATLKKPFGHPALYQGMNRGLMLMGQTCLMYLDDRQIETATKPRILTGNQGN